MFWRRIWGKISRLLSPEYGYCERCGITWRFAEGHTTQYTDREGCFPLCEKCWSELTPRERLFYYKKWFDQWYGLNLSEAGRKWQVIKKAVLDGK
ncbi:MAG: hypothetical protein ACYS1A_19635 [Planctomycetota bacterium]|jgi:hypothetical protein